MKNQILINITFNETRVALIENKRLAEIHVERDPAPQIVGNIYKGRVEKVINGMGSAFVSIGSGKSGFISLKNIYTKYLAEYIDEEENSDLKTSGSLEQLGLTEGQSVIVQVVKEPVKAKGPKLASYISIPGKLVVLVAPFSVLGVSRKITNEKERKRLLEIIKAHKQKNVGFIARTFSEKAQKTDIVKEIKNLTETWKKILKSYKSRKKPNLLYETPCLTLKVARDLINKDTNKIVVDSPETQELIKEYLSDNHNGKKINVTLHRQKQPLFEKYKIESEIENIYKKKVWLDSGGFLIIEETEGLTVIDVNTGKYTGVSDQEKTLLKINTEAAEEVARQIRLRNLVGIIVIDFVNVQDEKSQDSFYRTFRHALKNDKAKISVQDISRFSVVQLTRQRSRESLLNTLSHNCTICNGLGKIKSVQTIGYEIIRKVRSNLRKPRSGNITIEAADDIISYITESEKHNLSDLESKTGIKIKFVANDSLKSNHNFKIYNDINTK